MPTYAKAYPVGSEFSWGYPKALVIVEPKNDQPTENQVYIDHIYERLAQNVSPQELRILAEKLEMLAKQRGCPHKEIFTEHEFKFKAGDKVMLRPKDHPVHKEIISLWNEYYDSLGKILTIKTAIGGSITLEEDPLNFSRSAVRFELLQYSPELAKKLNLSFNPQKCAER